MPGIVTRKFRIHNASQFKEQFDEAANDRLYLFIGRVRPWPSEGSPPTPTNSVEASDFDYWRTMLAAKRVQAGDVSYAVPRYDWATGKRYREWNSSDSTLYDTPASSNTYYVMTDDYNVYKCLFNNKDATSTVEPTGTSTSTLVTADGYHWKYMYNITAADALKFQTTSYMPVQTLTENNGSTQWPVQEAAANGSVNIIDITAGGSSYQTHVGTLASVSNSSVVVLASGASATDNIYNNSALYISGGTGSGQTALKILDYVGSSKTATVANSTGGTTNPGFSPTPDGTSTYVLGPLVTVDGDGTTTATAFANGLKGRPDEMRYEDHSEKNTTFTFDGLSLENTIETQTIPMRNAMNEITRRAYVTDCEVGLKRWNRLIKKAGFDIQLKLFFLHYICLI